MVTVFFKFLKFRKKKKGVFIFEIFEAFDEKLGVKIYKGCYG